MFIDDCKYKRGNKSYRRVLLRNSYRVDGVVKHDTIANLAGCSDEEIDAIKFALKFKKNISKLKSIKDGFKTKQGLSIGAVWLLYQLAKKIGIIKALGNTRNAKLSLWMVFAAIIAQGSRLSAVRLAGNHAVCEILGLETFNEDDLYGAMDWLSENQSKIEDRLYKKHYGEKKPNIYLYDVTSSYFEGQKNELSEYGYNRDGKKGKKQIVIGLITDEDGLPISVEVFKGNTNDTKTFINQIEKVADRFGATDVTFVGDRGMIKSTQVEDLSDKHFHFITAITKAQIETLLKNNIIQMSLFYNEIVEVESDSIRYILRRNPVRLLEINDSYDSKMKRLNKLINEQNSYLKEHKKAKVEVAVKRIDEKIKRLKLSKWVEVENQDRMLSIVIDEEKKKEETKLDGCYVIKTDLKKEVASANKVHSQYKDLSSVEWAFRTMKTTCLEMRGIFVRKENRTRAHVFTIMLAYMMAYYLRRLWVDIDVTIEEGITELSTICGLEIKVADKVSSQSIPEPRNLGKMLLKKANVTLPDSLPCKNIKVSTRKKLVPTRKTMKFQWDAT